MVGGNKQSNRKKTMNVFVPEKPIVVIGPNGLVANNIDPDLKVVNLTCGTVAEFDVASKGMSFDSRKPRLEPQVFSRKK